MMASFLSSFSNILSWGIIHIADDPEVNGWKWIFIVEGAITIGVAILAFFVLVDFPESTRNTFLKPEEAAIVRARLLRERGYDEAEKVTWKVIKETITDWQVWSL